MQTITAQTPSGPVIVQVPSVADKITAAGPQLTSQDVRALRVRLDDLRDELQDAASRRNNVAGELKNADAGARPGYLARLEILDKRIFQAENEIQRVVQLMGTAPASALAGSSGSVAIPRGDPFEQSIANDIVPIVAILSVFVFAPIAIAVSRLIWKRTTATTRPAISDEATQHRLEGLQQAVDAIAIEVERISEGQRFVTRLLSDRSIGAGDADALRAPKKSALHTER